MREMKDSGAPWVGEIPQSWETAKLKYHLKREEQRNPGNCQVLSLYRELGIVPKEGREDNHNVTSEDTSKYKFVKPGNFVINKMKAWQGSVAVSDYEGIVSPAYYVYQFTDKCFYKKYFHYLLRSCYKEEFRRLSGGIREGQWDLPSEILDNILVVMPGLKEQISISNYLDLQCERVNEACNMIQHEIDNLESFKQSIISEAVTKGLNRQVKMQESGIGWIDRIPKSWSTRRAKYLFKQRNEKGNESILELLSPTQKYGVIPQSKYEEITGASAVKTNENTDLASFKTIHKGDFCISLRSFQGGFEYSEYEGVVSPAYQVFYATSDEVTDRYYRYLFKMPNFIAEMNSFTLSLRDGKSISFDDFGASYIPLPSTNEQTDIANFLDKKCADIDAIIASKQKQLEALDAYKKSLIFEYVTGKKEVL